MNNTDRIAIESHCTRALVDFLYYMDIQQYEKAVGLFTPDGVFDRVGQILKGRDEMLAALSQRPKSTIGRHLVSNIRFTSISADAAEAGLFVSAFMASSESGALPVTHALEEPMILDFTVQFRRTEQTWRIERQVAKLVIAPASVLKR